VPLWTNLYEGTFGFSSSTSEPTGMALDSSANVFVTGFSSASPFTGIDYVTLAYSGAGTPLWTNGYTGPGKAAQDVATAIAVDNSGNVFVTGQSTNSSSGLDYATIAYSGTGGPLWTNRYNGPGNGNDYAEAVAADSSGNVFLTGYSANGSSGYDYATLAYSSAGALVWTNYYNGTGNSTNHVRAMEVDTNSGNVFVTGYSTSSAGDYDYATLAYSSAGVPLWTNRYNGPGNGGDYAEALATDGSGNVFATGYSVGIGCSNDYATVAYSSGGLPLWTNRYNGEANGDDRAVAVAVDGNDNVFVTGYSIGSSGNYDYLTIAYSSAGVPLWTNRFNSPYNLDDYAKAITVDSSGNVFVTGYSWASGSGYGWYDYATIKYSAIVQAYLGIQLISDQNQVVLSWTNAAFNLQSAPFTSGTFTNILGATSPYPCPITGSQQYFRLVAN